LSAVHIPAAFSAYFMSFNPFFMDDVDEHGAIVAEVAPATSPLDNSRQLSHEISEHARSEQFNFTVSPRSPIVESQMDQSAAASPSNLPLKASPSVYEDPTDIKLRDDYERGMRRVLTRSSLLQAQGVVATPSVTPSSSLRIHPRGDTVTGINSPRSFPSSPLQAIELESIYEIPRKRLPSRGSSMDLGNESDSNDEDEVSIAPDELQQRLADARAAAMNVSDGWYREELQRRSVEPFLKGRDEGSFVLRPSSLVDCKALCVKHGTIVVHYLVER
jgi:hypothetical protein